MSVPRFETLSGVSRIKIKENACSLFKQWLDEFKLAQKLNTDIVVFNLATSSLGGHVKNRSLVVRELLPDGSIAILSPANGDKFKDINENPRVAATFLFYYLQNDKLINRQIRLEGVAEKLPHENCMKYYDADNLTGKIRAWICNQGEEVDWDVLHKKYEDFVEKVRLDGAEPQVPPILVAYKIIPNKMDFYDSFNNAIADRVIFTRLEDNKWRHKRVFT